MAWFSPASLLVPDMIALNAAHRPGRAAVIDGERSCNWAEFAAGTGALGNALRSAGLRKGDRVVVLMQNSFEMVEAMFGVLCAGMVAVPLNVSITDDAVAAMIANSRARALIASDPHLDRVDQIREQIESQIETRFLAPDAARPGWLDYVAFRDSGRGAAAPVDIAPGDECNIIYSSGTTGLPKGIVHDHYCRAAWASEMAMSLRYHSAARTLCSLGLFSNISWVAMLATIAVGGTIVLQRRFSVTEWFEIVSRERITHTAMVPLQFQKILDGLEQNTQDLSSLDAYMCCGSPLASATKRAIRDRLPGQFIELYGLTEGLVTILDPEDLEHKTESVGLPCPGQSIAIVDDDGVQLETGGVGEIVGLSRFIMAGYLDNDAANEAATWQHPSGQRWLRTGDIGRLDDEGYLYLVDRKKDMIISGGQNIYPADIEEVLLRHDAVRELAVIGVNSRKWGETPLAVVVLADNEEIDADALTVWANQHLGKQQRIAATVFVDELPRNPNGKVLKRELRDRFADVVF